VTHCVSIKADGFHSLSDGASNIICLVGIFCAYRPKDSNHPYGHKKYETFFSLGIAALLFLVALELLEEGIRRFIHPVTPDINAWSFIVMVGTLIINALVMRYEYRKGKLLQSDMLIYDSLHTRADIFTSLSVILTLVFIKLGMPLLDPIATIVIVCFIAHSGYQIIKESARVLCDTAAIVDIGRIENIVLAVPGVKTCHKIRTRGRSDDVCVDLHVQVNPGMHIEQAHKISYAIEDALKKGIPEISDVVVHMEPREKEKSE
jgi:cation diffusion facilitator family transporter